MFTSAAFTDNCAANASERWNEGRYNQQYRHDGNDNLGAILLGTNSISAIIASSQRSSGLKKHSVENRRHMTDRWRLIVARASLANLQYAGLGLSSDLPVISIIQVVNQKLHQSGDFEFELR